MPAIKYIVDLTNSEREQLLDVTHRGKSSARKVKRALILCKSDEGLTDAQIAGALGVGTATVSRTRKRFVEEGLERALNERPRPGQPRKFNGKQEAHLIAVTCSQPPDGHGRWTLRLLAGKAVELGFVESVSPETVRQTLKKTNLSPGRKLSGAFPR
jgi:transposase